MMQHLKWRAPDIAVFPTNTATHSSCKVDHCGPYANKCGGGSEGVDNGKEGKKQRENAGWGRGVEEGIKLCYQEAEAP